MSVCILCGSSDSSIECDEIGEVKNWGTVASQIPIHEGCLYFSDEVNIDEQSPAEEIIECNPKEVENIVKRSRSEKCCICSELGASITPHHPDAKGLKVHLSCAYRNSFRIGRQDSYDQRRLAIPPTEWKPRGNMDDVTWSLGPNSILNSL
jgi:hypothetical protein